MKLHEIPVQFVIVDRDGHVESKGRPRINPEVDRMHFWPDFEEAKALCDVLNRIRSEQFRPYSVKRVRIQEDR